jgi:hypothetical protein
VLQRCLENGNLWVAEAVARELRPLSLEDALKLTYLYAEKEQWSDRTWEWRTASDVPKVVLNKTESFSLDPQTHTC